MIAIQYLVMLTWPVVVLGLFALLPPRRAVIVSFLTAWLFLPVVNYKVPILPDYTKMSATCAAIFAATLLFDAKRVLRFMPGWVDLPMVVFCLCPFVGSMTNGLGPWDGISGILQYVITWGMPFLIGRLYFNDVKGLRELAIGVFIGGLVYVPLCLFEVRMSPQLHRLVYGEAPREVQMRFGGWRPSVFMDGGLQVGLWMVGVSLISIWLWKTGALKRLRNISVIWLIIPLVATTLLCRATGAIALLALGLGAMWLCWAMKSRLALICLLMIAPTYITLRATGMWHGEPLVEMANWISTDRAGSLKFRFDNEDMLVAQAVKQPWFGWGGWGRNRVHDAWGRDVSVTDGFWIIEFGQHGAIGVASGFMAMLLPLALLIRRFPPKRLTSVEMAPALAFAVLVTIYAIDCLPNGLINPVFMLLDGAVISFAIAPQSLRSTVLRDGVSQSRKDLVADSIPPRRPYPSCS